MLYLKALSSGFSAFRNGFRLALRNSEREVIRRAPRVPKTTGPVAYHPKFPASEPSAFYILAAPRGNGECAYPEVSTDGLIIYNEPRQAFDEDDLPMLKQLILFTSVQRRVWVDETVDLASLFIYRIEMTVTKVNHVHDMEDEQYERMAAVAKLTNREAELLGVTQDKAMQIISEVPDDDVQNLLRDLRQRAKEPFEIPSN